jgi:hypothetical protein
LEDDGNRMSLPYEGMDPIGGGGGGKKEYEQKLQQCQDERNIQVEEYRKERRTRMSNEKTRSFDLGKCALDLKRKCLQWNDEWLETVEALEAQSDTEAALVEFLWKKDKFLNKWWRSYRIS